MEDNTKIAIEIRNLETLIDVGLALSTEKELNSFFKVVLDAAQDISGADAGTVYLKIKDQLHFMVVNNNTLGIQTGEESKPISLPPVPMEEIYACAYVALRGTPLKIDDIYKTDLFDFEGPRKYDKITGYRTQSILIVPMRNQHNEVIGVIELINAKDRETGENIPFSEIMMNILGSFASQAAVAFERTEMMKSLEEQLVTIQGLRQSEEELNKKLRDAFQKLETKNQKLEEGVKNIKLSRYKAVFLLAIAVTGVWIYNKNSEFSLERIKNLTNNEKILETPSFEKTALVKRDMVMDSITLTGTLKPLKTVHITSPIEGTIKQTHFNYGEKVKKGEPLFTLKSSTLEIGYREAEAEFLNKKSELQKLLDWESSVEIANARRSLKISKLDYEKQQSNLIQIENLYRKDIVARQEVEQANRQVITAEGQYESSKEQLELIVKKRNPISLTIARNRLENAKMKLISFKENLNKVIIPVPVAGIVLRAEGGMGSLPEITVGQDVKPGQLLISIGDLSGFSIKTKVDEVDILKIKKGQIVWVTGDAFPKNRLKGFVRMISSQAEVSRGRGGRPFFSVIVDVDKIDPEVQEKLFIGMSANLEIITYKNPTAMVLPVESVQLRGEIAYTNVKTEGGVKKVKLRIGITSPQNVEIKSGLKEGDKVVY